MHGFLDPKPVTVTQKDALARNEYALRRESTEAIDAWDTALRSLFTEHNNSSASPPISPFESDRHIIHIDHPASHNHHHHYIPNHIHSLPSPTPSLTPPPLVFLPRTRVSYAITHFLAYIISFATTGHTPFLNRHAFTTYTQSSVTPTPLLEAFCVAAAYTFSPPRSATRVLALSAIAGRAAALVEAAREKERTASRGCSAWDWPMTSLEDLLANVQALLVYQIVQLFDGDIAARCMAERHEAVLASWTRVLAQRHATEPEPCLDLQSTVPMTYIPSSPALSPSSLPAASPFTSPPIAASKTTPTTPWRAWLLSESIRRTVIVEMLLRGIYGATKEGCCDVVHSLARLPLTDRGRLWDAQTEWEWVRETEAEAGVDIEEYGELSDHTGGDGYGVETGWISASNWGAKTNLKRTKKMPPLVGYQEMIDTWSKERESVWTAQRDGLQILLLKMCKGSAEEGVA